MCQQLARPTGPTNAGLAAFWNMLIRLNRLSRGRPQSAKEKADVRGWSGAVNIEVTGPGGGAWHLEFLPDRVWIREGRHPEARGVVTASVDEFFRLLWGEASFYVALMTGRVRIDGDGHCGNVFWGIISRVQGAAVQKGLGGMLTGWWLARVKRLSIGGSK